MLETFFLGNKYTISKIVYYIFELITPRETNLRLTFETSSKIKNVLYVLRTLRSQQRLQSIVR